MGRNYRRSTRTKSFASAARGFASCGAFADLLEYETTPAGNRLRMGFTGVKASAVAE
jgi:hypothetical protein